MTEPRILRSNISVVDVPERSVGEYIWNKLNQLDEKSICLINAESNEQLTVGALKHRCQAVATALLAHGIARTDRLAFYGQNTIPHVVLRLATKFLGLPVCPLSPTFEAYEVDQECQSIGVTVVVCSASHLHKFNRLLESDYKHNIRLVVVFDGHHDSHVTYNQLLVEGGDQALTKVPHFPVNPDVDPVILIHTSGSTGRPKCVMLKHRSILALLSERGHFLDPGTGTDHVIGAPYPMGHISGTSIIPLQLCLGARLVIYPDFDVELLFKSIERYKINFLPTFPSFGRKLVEGDLCDKYDLSSLRTVNTGGSPLAASISLAIIEKYGVVFREGYGLTEYLFVGRGTDVDQPFIPGSIGPVSPGTEVKIVDITTGAMLGPDTNGEICVRGNKMFAGYLNNEKAYREAFDGEGWYRTGDIGRYDGRENIYITDRLKEVIRIGIGNTYINISPVEIESYVLTHPAVEETAVVGVNNKAGTHWPRAYVMRKHGCHVSAEEIKSFVSDTLAQTKHLKGGVVFVDSIKRIGMGKVDRKYYRALVSDEIID